MSHAVIKAGGKQFLVTEGQTIRVPSMAVDAGSSIELDPLISSGSGDGKISATWEVVELHAWGAAAFIPRRRPGTRGRAAFPPELLRKP